MYRFSRAVKTSQRQMLVQSSNSRSLLFIRSASTLAYPGMMMQKSTFLMKCVRSYVVPDRLGKQQTHFLLESTMILEYVLSVSPTNISCHHPTSDQHSVPLATITDIDVHTHAREQTKHCTNSEHRRTRMIRHLTN